MGSRYTLGMVMRDVFMLSCCCVDMLIIWILLRQINYLSFNCQLGSFVKLAKRACTIYARN